jgi:hypothetical protein
MPAAVPYARAHHRRPDRRRYRRRRAPALLLLAAAALIGVDLIHAGGRLGEMAGSRSAPAAVALAGAAGAARAGGPATSSSATVPGAAGGDHPATDGFSMAREFPTAGDVPVIGPGTFEYAGLPGPVLGRAGTLRRFRVAVEHGLGSQETPEAFADAVDGNLGDERSWIAGGRLRLQRVAGGSAAEFTIYLATPGTSRRMCAAGGLDTQAYTSCRLPGKVIINVARWLTAVPGYGAPLTEYQAYTINHEVGHELGYGHEACPGPGRPAPVMQQQTLGLAGCVAYGWPYLDGRRYAGPAVW